MIQEAIAKVVERGNLSADEARQVMCEMIGGAATPSQIAAFITAMRMKGETEDELLGFVQAMRERCLRIDSPPGAVDLCGTGGDGKNTFNISTAASFVVAAAGVPVAKHGNRSVSSRCGSADVLSAMGIPVELGPEQASRCLRSAGMCFMFAPLFHASMRNVLGPRRELGVRTFFNLLGPMTNPACVTNQLIGVYDFAVARKIVSVLTRLGSSRVMVVNGDGTDEITNTGETRVVESIDGKLREYELSPEMFDMPLARPEDVAGGDACQNARTLLSIMKGERSPRADIVALNAGAALYIAGRASTVEDGVALAEELLRSGRALAKAKEFAETARALETERQMAQGVSELRPAYIMPSVLVRRAPALVEELVSQVKERGLQPELEGLDPELVEHPSVLSVIALRRVLSAASQPVPEGPEPAKGRASLSEALKRCAGVGVIAEYKPRSPSAPALLVPPRPEEALEAFARSGAAAVSVLAEPEFFGGSNELFAMFRRGLGLPMLYKDFVVCEKQLETASTLGADAVLLVAKMLAKPALERLVSRSVSLGLEPFVELHDMDDLSKLLSCRNEHLVRLVGLNSRDLRTMSVDLARLEALRAFVPPRKVVVAESGVKGPGDVAHLKGFDGVLIGSALMAADDLGTCLESIVDACRGCGR